MEFVSSGCYFVVSNLTQQNIQYTQKFWWKLCLWNIRSAIRISRISHQIQDSYWRVHFIEWTNLFIILSLIILPSTWQSKIVLSSIDFQKNFVSKKKKYFVCKVEWRFELTFNYKLCYGNGSMWSHVRALQKRYFWIGTEVNGR